MKIRATTPSGKFFLLPVTLTGEKDYACVTANLDRLHEVQVELPDGTLLWVSHSDCRTDRGESVEESGWPWPFTKQWKVP